MKKLKKILSGVAAIAMAASSFMGLTTAHAADTGSITINLPKLEAPKSDVATIALEKGADSYGDLTFTAYQILAEDENTGTYTVTAPFEAFFPTEWPSGSPVYLTYANGKLTASTTAPSDETTEKITITDVSKIDSNFLPVTILDAINTASGENLLAKWLEDYAETKVIWNDSNKQYREVKKVSDPGAFSDGKIKFDNLGLGYWLVASSNEPAGVAITNTIVKVTKQDSDKTVTIKADDITFEKKVKDGSDWKDDTTASIGDKIDYKVTFDVQSLTNYTSGYFKFSDTLTNQELTTIDDKGTNFKITIGSTTYEFKIDGTTAQVWSADANEGNGGWVATTIIKNITNTGYGSDKKQTISFEIDFATLKAAAANKIKVTVEYAAVLKTDAAWANDNEAGLDYTNTPSGDRKQFEDHTTVYTYGLNIQKNFKDNGQAVDTDKAKELAKQVKFRLYETGTDNASKKQVQSSEPTACQDETHDGTDTPHEDECYPMVDAPALKFSTTPNKYTYDPTNGTITDLELDENGKLHVYGLDEGYYILEESSYPSGYSKIDNVVVHIGTVTDTSDAHYGEVSATNSSAVGSVTVDNKTHEAWYNATTGDITTEDKTGVDGYEKITVIDESNLAFSIDNVKISTELPGTGGMGVWLFGIGGVLMLAGAAYVFTSRKRGQA